MDYHIRTLDQLRPILVGLRKQAGLSQLAVASLLGVTQQSYAKFEASPSAASVERLFKILHLLGASITVSERGTPDNWREYFTEPVAAGPRPERPKKSASADSGAQARRKSVKKAQVAPAKLLAPSHKKEKW